LLPATRPATARAAYATSRAPRHLKRQSLAPGQTGKLLARRLRRVPLELGEQSTQLAQAPDHVQTRAVPVSLDEFQFDPMQPLLLLDKLRIQRLGENELLGLVHIRPQEADEVRRVRVFGLRPPERHRPPD